MSITDYSDYIKGLIREEIAPLRQEIATLKATIAELTKDKKEKGKEPETYCKKPFYNTNKISFGEINYE